jgi:hypothetical protein
LSAVARRAFKREGVVVTGAAQRRQEALERARWRRRRRAEERDREPLRRAMILGGAVGIVVGGVLGQLLWLHELAGPAIAAVLGLGLGVAVGAGVVLEREHAVQRALARAEARAHEEERARRRVQARRERREKRAAAPAVAVVAATARAEQADGEFIVPPGFYPDPRGGKGRRWWDGEHWTEKLQPAGET